jgi:hypothetical protein
MLGHTTGQDDYVWIYENGLMHLYESPGTTFPSEAPYWGANSVMFDTERDGVEYNRKDLHLVDWDGDGACDIVYVEPSGGTVSVWINNIITTGDFNWEYNSNPASALSCAETRGVGLFDLAVTFADLTYVFYATIQSLDLCC